MKKIVLLSLSVFAAFSLFAQQPRDWAQYGRYERQNAALAGEPVEVVFMGNSITDNWIGADPDFFARNGFVDRGISGQTTAEMLARFRRDVIDLNPKAVVILAGINSRLPPIWLGSQKIGSSGMRRRNSIGICHWGRLR